MSALTETNLKQEASPDHSSYAAELFAAAREELGRRRAVPESTYRLQFHAGFTFRDATAIVPYLADLGISDCYASPYLKAAPGSTHGYDITDHQLLNPEIGTPEEHFGLLEALRDHGLGLVLDVVPNHMGILGNENPWWNDVLENGQASPYAGYFDIDWWAPTRPENHGRVLLPLLGDLYGEVLERGELRVSWEGGAFHVRIRDQRSADLARDEGVVHVFAHAFARRRRRAGDERDRGNCNQRPHGVEIRPSITHRLLGLVGVVFRRPVAHVPPSIRA